MGGGKIEEYLGDGVYASYDGYHIVLDLRAQDSSRIALEPAVFNALLRFRNYVMEAEKEANPIQTAEPAKEN